MDKMLWCDHILSSVLNDRGQVDLTDYRTLPDGEFKWILHYEEHLTKFSFLRPLKCKEAKEVAAVLLDTTSPRVFLTHITSGILEEDVESILADNDELHAAVKTPDKSANGDVTVLSSDIETALQEVDTIEIDVPLLSVIEMPLSSTEMTRTISDNSGVTEAKIDELLRSTRENEELQEENDTVSSSIVTSLESLQ